jgi:hypothetical protein
MNDDRETTDLRDRQTISDQAARIAELERELSNLKKPQIGGAGL